MILTSRLPFSSGVQPFLLGGQWKAGSDVQEIRVPYDGAVLGRVARAGQAEVDQAVDLALKAFQTFRHSPVHQRRSILLKAAELIGRHHDFLVELLAREAGKPVMFASGEVKRMKITFDLAAAELTRFGGEMLPVDFDERAENCQCLTRRFPVGVVAAIVPYNWPYNLAAHKIAPALATGNTLLIKPASATPFCTLALGEILVEAGAPAGTVSILPCESKLAQRWVEDDRVAMVSFTGSPPVGWKLKSIAGRKRVSLELGGNAALVVHEDADLDKAVQKAVIGGYGYAGQVCISVQRVLVHEPIYAAFRGKLAKATRDCPAGDPMDSQCVSGPLIDAVNANRVECWIQEAVQQGAVVLAGGTRQGNLVAPTLLDHVKSAMRVCKDEVFGPVMTLEPYKTWDEALAKVNDSQFGLQAGIFTHDSGRIHRAFEVLDVGGVIVNDFPTMRVDNFPYGGIKNSGFGREGVRYAMEEMTELKVLFERFSG